MLNELTLLEPQVRDPFYGWTSVLHERVQACYECLLFHVHLIGVRVFFTFGQRIMDLNDGGRGLRHRGKKTFIRERGKITKYARHAWNATQAAALILKAVLQLTVLSQMGKDDTCSHLMGCKSWNETWESEGKVLPLLSIDNRYTSCLERKQHACGVFGLALSVAGITNVTLKNKQAGTWSAVNSKHQICNEQYASPLILLCNSYTSF